ncbi:hypothetical protein EH223_14135 [candidate division KSB1 bacterium]|nr:MAG: hypothetical protein EH223_14135 [candidate division KSB1 bacterium]
MKQAINNGDIDELAQTRQLFERMLMMNQQEWLVHYYIALANQNLYYFVRDDQDQQAKLINDAIEHLEMSLELNKKFAESWTLLANMYGLQIGVDSKNTIQLSKKQKKAIKTATKLEPDNPRLYLVSGRSAYFVPKAFGGGFEKAKADLAKALDLFSSYEPPSDIYPQWGEDETYVWLGQIAAREDSLQLAEYYYQKALKINPEYKWVSNYLLPTLKKKMNATVQSDF